jgi:hypothetical protein
MHLSRKPNDFTAAQVVVKDRLVGQIPNPSLDFHAVTKAI